MPYGYACMTRIAAHTYISKTNLSIHLLISENVRIYLRNVELKSEVMHLHGTGDGMRANRVQIATDEGRGGPGQRSGRR